MNNTPLREGTIWGFGLLVLSLLDLYTTSVILALPGGYEVNPLTSYLLTRWGWCPVLFLKGASVVFLVVVVSLLYRGQRRSEVVVKLGTTALLVIVVLWGTYLIQTST